MHLGLTSAQAHARASSIAQQSQGAGGSAARIPHFIRLDFAEATQTVLYVMAAIMAAAAIAGFVGLRAGVQEEVVGTEAQDAEGSFPEGSSPDIAGPGLGQGPEQGRLAGPSR